MSPSLNEQEIQAGISNQLIELYEKISSWEQDVVKGSGLSPAQMHAIEMLGHDGAPRMKELAGKMGITTGTLTVMVDRLEQQGLIRRSPHESDRRSFQLHLTEQGQRLFAEHHALHRQLTRDLTASLSRDELATLVALLGKLLTQL